MNEGQNSELLVRAMIALIKNAGGSLKISKKDLCDAFDDKLPLHAIKVDAEGDSVTLSIASENHRLELMIEKIAGMFADLSAGKN